MNKAGAQKEESTQLGLALMNADYRSQGNTDEITDLTGLICFAEW